MKWKYLLFDLDGTVTDSSEGITACVKYAYEAVGIEIPSENELLSYIGPPLIDGFQKIAKMSEKQALFAIEKYRERYSVTGLFENRVYDGIEKMLAELKKSGYIIALATSKPEEYSIRILEHFKLQKYFDVVVGSTLCGQRNCKADVIREVFRRLEIDEKEKEHAIMIGDRFHDINGAKTCGISSLGVRYGFAKDGELEEAGADYIVSEVCDIVPFFNKEERREK